MRTASAHLRGHIAKRIRPAVAAIAQELNHRELSDSIYAVVFGYALDTLLWDRLKSRDLLPETDLDRAHPLWRGAFWAISPERIGAAGVNEAGDGERKLSMVWSDASIARLRDYAASDDGRVVLASLDRIEASNLSPELLKNAQPAFAVIRADDRLAELSTIIADEVSHALITDPEGRALIDSIHHADDRQALVVVTHELIWDIADALEAQAQIHKPMALQSAAGDLSPLFFVRITAPAP